VYFAEKMGVNILAETKVEKIIYKDNLYHILTRSVKHGAGFINNRFYDNRRTLAGL